MAPIDHLLYIGLHARGSAHIILILTTSLRSRVVLLYHMYEEAGARGFLGMKHIWCIWGFRYRRCGALIQILRIEWSVLWNHSSTPFATCSMTLVFRVFSCVRFTHVLTAKGFTKQCPSTVFRGAGGVKSVDLASSCLDFSLTVSSTCCVTMGRTMNFSVP